MEQPPSEAPHAFPALGSAFQPPALGAMLSAVGHSGLLGLRYQGHGDDWIEVALPWRDDLVGLPDSGVLASGPIISLLDTATSLSVVIRAGEFLRVATLDLRIDYMRAARTGATVVARGTCYRMARSVAFVRGTAHDGDPDDPIAQVAGTFMRMSAA
jgi:uncharacterized protein (TIGR00369 family)